MLPVTADGDGETGPDVRNGELGQAATLLTRQLVCRHPLGLRDQLVQVDEGGPAALHLTQPPPGTHRIRTVFNLGGGQSVGQRSGGCFAYRPAGPSRLPRAALPLRASPSSRINPPPLLQLAAAVQM